MVEIREERPEDAAGVWEVEEQAFGRPKEAELVAALRQEGAVSLSMVAVEGGQVVGHALFSPVTIEGAEQTTQAIALGPMAVRPTHQRRGVGTQLVRAALAECGRRGHDLVVVLGHPDYYPRFGFAPSRPMGIRPAFDVPEEVFMALELRQGAAAGHQGIAHYHRAFHSA